MRIGMGCKAQSLPMADAIGKDCNAADRPSTRPHTREGIANRLLDLFIVSRYDW